MSFQKRIFGEYLPGKPEIKRVELPESHEIGGGNTEEKEKKLYSGFNETLEKIQKESSLEARISRLKALPDCNGILGKLDQYFTHEHWEMVAVLEEYDQKTFDHSLRVSQFVYEISTSGGETEKYLKEQIRAEHGSLRELYTAALFHDIGKTAIPCNILHDDHSRREWAKRANTWATKNNTPHFFDQEKLNDPEEGGLNEADLDQYFIEIKKTNGTDSLDIVPIEEVFNEDALKKLEEKGLSGKTTFRKILEQHENATRAILRKKKMFIAADIAAHHHDYEKRPLRTERYPTETSALRIGYELSILRSMDVYDALTSYDRSYKKPYHPLLALEIIIREAEAEFTDLELTKRIVLDLYQELVKKEKHLPASPQEETAQEKILRFIEKR